MYASSASFRALPVSGRVSALCCQLAIIFAIIALSSTSWFIHKGDIKKVQLSTGVMSATCGTIQVKYGLKWATETGIISSYCAGTSADVTIYKSVKYTDPVCWENPPGSRPSGVSEDTGQRACNLCHSAGSYATASLILVILCEVATVYYQIARAYKKHERFLYRSTTLYVISVKFIILMMAIIGIVNYSRCILYSEMNNQTHDPIQYGDTIVWDVLGETETTGTGWIVGIISVIFFFFSTTIMTLSYIPWKKQENYQNSINQELI